MLMDEYKEQCGWHNNCKTVSSQLELLEYHWDKLLLKWLLSVQLLLYTIVLPVDTRGRGAERKITAGASLHFLSKGWNSCMHACMQCSLGADCCVGIARFFHVCDVIEKIGGGWFHKKNGK